MEARRAPLAALDCPFARGRRHHSQAPTWTVPVSVYIRARGPKTMARFVRSPVTHKSYRIVCSRQGTRVFCSNRRYGIWLRFTWLG